MREQARRERDASDPHLRSARVVGGCHVRATDGEIGHVDELLLEPRSWTVNFLVIDTRNWRPGAHVLVPRQALARVSWSERVAYVAMTREAIRSRPTYVRGQGPASGHARRHRASGRASGPAGN